MLCTAVMLSEQSIDLLLDAIRTKKNEMMDNLVFVGKEHDDINRVESLLIDAKASFHTAKTMIKDRV